MQCEMMNFKKNIFSDQIRKNRKKINKKVHSCNPQCTESWYTVDCMVKSSHLLDFFLMYVITITL